MKTTFALIAMLFVGSFAVSAEERVLPETRFATSSEIASADSVLDHGSYCSALTECANGRQIGCTAQGLVTRCQRAHGARVVCQAWGSHGTYSASSDQCR